MLKIQTRKLKLRKVNLLVKRKIETCIKCCVEIYVQFPSSNKLNSPSESHLSTSESEST